MKKMKYIYMAVALLAGLSACDEVADIDSPDVNITADKKVITAADSTIHFSFEGDADYIVFFSGEKGHKYINRNRGKIDVSSATLNFNSAVNYGLYDKENPTVKLKISTDFSGTNTVEEIEKANWIDVSDRFTWPATKTFDPTTPSGNMDLREYIDKQFYVAFHYYEENNGAQSYNTWALPAFNIDVESEIDGHISVANIRNAGYAFVKKSGPAIYNAGAYRIQGGSAATTTNEAWIVTRKFDATSVSPDTGTALTEYTGSRTAYSYTYPYSSMEPGTYIATFVVRNANIHGAKEVISEVAFTVE